jgi:hypothetical protein
MGITLDSSERALEEASFVEVDSTVTLAKISDGPSLDGKADLDKMCESNSWGAL